MGTVELIESMIIGIGHIHDISSYLTEVLVQAIETDIVEGDKLACPPYDMRTIRLMDHLGFFEYEKTERADTLEPVKYYRLTDKGLDFYKAIKKEKEKAKDWNFDKFIADSKKKNYIKDKDLKLLKLRESK